MKRDVAILLLIAVILTGTAVVANRMAINHAEQTKLWQEYRYGAGV